MKILISVIMAMLVIMITPAYALQMDIIQYSGSDDIDGYAGSNDAIMIKAEVEIFGSPTMEVAARRLRIHHSGISERFDTCASHGQTVFICTYETTGAYSGEQTFRIDLLDADGNVIETIDKIIKIDNQAPMMIDYDVNPKRSKSEKVTIDYQAEDYSQAIGDTEMCSGIKEVQFLINNQKVAAEAGSLGSCIKQNTFDYTRSGNLEYEQITLCSKAVDFLGQESVPICKDYEIDNHAPEIISFHVKDADGFDMTGIRSGTNVVGTVEAIVEGDNDDIASVTADLSSLNPTYTGFREPDEIYETSYIWRDVPITSPSNCQASIKAVDDLGNSNTETKTCSLPVDDLGPEVVKIETNFTDDDSTYLIGDKGTIKMEIREAGAGLFRKHVYLDLSNLGRDYSMEQRADECHIKTGDVWECSWYAEPKVPNGDYTIRTRPSTRDDLDNAISSTTDITLRVDRQPPRITNVDYSVEHAFAEYGDLTVKGDTIEFKVQTSDTSYAYADFEGIGGGYEPGTCSGTDMRTCIFSQIIHRSGPDNATIFLEFFDRAGNKEIYEEDITIYGILEDTAPEYWNHTVDCSPKLIDRSTTTQKEQLIYCHIQLTTTNDEAEPIYTSTDTSLGECTGAKEGVAEIQMMNNGVNSRDPYMMITLELADFAVNNQSFTCPIYVSTKIGDYFSKSDEKEYIDVDLEFYNLPMGEISENIERNINHEMRKAMFQMKWIDDLEKYMDLMRTFCNMKSTWVSILSALDTVLAAFAPFISLLEVSGQKDGANQAEKVRYRICADVKGPLEAKLFGPGKSGKYEPIKSVEKIQLADLWRMLDMACDFLNCKLTWDQTKYDRFGEPGELIVGIGGGGIGGEKGLCRAAENLLTGSGALGEKGYAEFEKLQDKMKQPGDVRPRLTDVKESLVWSTLCQCLPGISYNINKMRQINCKYAICLAEDVKNLGIDPAWCRAEKSYLTCTYVMGEIFAITPFVAIWDNAINTVKEWFENPIALIGAVSGCLCGGCAEFGLDPFYCSKEIGKVDQLTASEQAWGYIACIAPKTLAKISDAIVSIKSTSSTSISKQFTLGQNYCDKAKELGLDTKYGK